ncbi:class I adenylate-forming enzyme family protein [Amycolatopsis jejuensis]|uniref:class I adenylate-forming enzyme family protein n=1 Tax=Amycolatopsis jejuensis TaxID=330084 RepID=UPI000524D5B2|nr:class I adenylate-forming enzyme family protein [Amycolatopsis jejuensis]
MAAHRMGDLVSELFAARPGDLPYLVHAHGSVSRAALDADSAEEAAVFRAYDIGEGSTVLLQIPPSCTQVEVLLALWRVGAQVLLVDHRLTGAEVDQLRRLCRPQFLVRGGVAGKSVLGFQERYELVTARLPGGRAADSAHRLVQFSSGSTGVPKVIGRTPESVAAEIARFAAIPGMPVQGERVLLLSSTAHSFGLIAGLLYALAHGVTVVFAPRVSARDMLATAAENDVAAIFGTPFHYELLTTAASVPPLPKLRVAVSGGELMVPAVAEAFRERFGVGIGESYGTTETGVIAMDTAPAHRPSVGPPAPGIEVRIADGELEVHLPDGSPYLHGSGGDRYVDSWLRTRDRAEITADGTVSLLGRGDSLVVVGGLKVDLLEVEAVLREHPGVTEAVVVHTGTIEAYVSVSAAGPSKVDLLRWCRERLAAFKHPKLLHVLPALPRTSNGKLVRHAGALRAAEPAAAR